MRHGTDTAAQRGRRDDHDPASVVEAARRIAERDAFLVKLADALRPLADAAAIEQTAMRLLGAHLGVSRATYVTHDPPLDDPRRQAFERTDAHVKVPLVKEGRCVAQAELSHREPRAWTDQEVALLEETAERTWTALERARTEQELRETSARLQLALDIADIGVYGVDLDTDTVFADARARELIAGIAGGGRSEAIEQAVHPEDRGRYATTIEAALDPAGEGLYADEVRTLRPSGRTGWVRVLGRVEFDRDEIPRRLVATVQDVDERRRLEETLRRTAEHDGFLLALADALRPIGDPARVQEAAAQVLGLQLGVNRVAYAEISPDESFSTVLADFHIGVPSAAGRHRMDAYGAELMEELRVGETIVVGDVDTDTRLTAEARAVFHSVGSASTFGVPLLKDGRLSAVLAVHHAQPRAWTLEEIALGEETAERTWAAVERAKAEAALRARARGRTRR